MSITSAVGFNERLFIVVRRDCLDRVAGLNDDRATTATAEVVNVRNEMTLAWEEIFGLVLSGIAYDSEEEAIAIANDSKAGQE